MRGGEGKKGRGGGGGGVRGVERLQFREAVFTLNYTTRKRRYYGPNVTFSFPFVEN